MTKFNLFISFLKERDWLEEMARQGWMLNNITLGMFYHFQKCEPCEKVYEIERFAITSRPSVAELTARTDAIDITSQFGWKLVTHDEEMNYYFVKDRSGDETDEFYEDAESRRARAERFRNHYAIDLPFREIRIILLVSLIYILFYLLLWKMTGTLPFSMAIIYILFITFDSGMLFTAIKMGCCNYTELCMSRTEWARHKKHDEKKRFRKVQQLRSFLQEKSESGLSLSGYANGYYQFEEDSQRYNYFVDTRKCLKKRLKKEGIHFTDETKDYSTLSLKWYELSIGNAAQYDLKPVAAVGKNILLYKRPYSDAPLPWENGNENINLYAYTKAAILLLGCSFAVGAIMGFIMSYIEHK